MQVEQIRWDTAAPFALPVSTWREMIRTTTQRADGLPLGTETLDALAARKAQLGLTSFDATVAALLREER